MLARSGSLKRFQIQLKRLRCESKKVVNLSWRAQGRCWSNCPLHTTDREERKALRPTFGPANIDQPSGIMTSIYK